MCTNPYQWRDGRRGQDGWGRYTRRRKWYRDAELVEVTPSTEVTPIPTPKLDPVPDYLEPLTQTSTGKSSSSLDATVNGRTSSEYAPSTAPSTTSDTDAASSKSKRHWFKAKRRSRSGNGSDKAPTIASSTSTDMSRRSDEDDVHTPFKSSTREDEWRLGDDMRMQLDI